jgi:hypothetical protein
VGLVNFELRKTVSQIFSALVRNDTASFASTYVFSNPDILATLVRGYVATAWLVCVGVWVCGCVGVCVCVLFLPLCLRACLVCLVMSCMPSHACSCVCVCSCVRVRACLLAFVPAWSCLLVCGRSMASDGCRGAG